MNDGPFPELAVELVIPGSKRPSEHSDLQVPHKLPMTPVILERRAASLSETSNAQDIYIAVMGMTGTGKSTFIRSLTGSEDIRIGHELVSCTTEIQAASFNFNENITVHLVDTPGFDDSDQPDTKILANLVAWLDATQLEGKYLSGIIYLHRIFDNRLGGTAIQNLRMLEKLTGEASFSRIWLTTTMWEQKGLEFSPSDTFKRFEKRETELKDGEWRYMISKGANIKRHNNTHSSARSIIEEILQNVKDKQPCTLAIQEERKKGLNINDTGAGRMVTARLRYRIDNIRDDVTSTTQELEEYENTTQPAPAILEDLRNRLNELQERLKRLTKELFRFEKHGEKDVKKKTAELRKVRGGERKTGPGRACTIQ